MTQPISFDRSMDFAYGIATEIAPGVRRLVARNPGPLTFKGTNTYLVGRNEIAVIDPGPDDVMHRRAIQAAAGHGRITHILLTHTHRDHSAGLLALREATGALTCGFGISDPRRAAAIRHVEARAVLEHHFEPDVRLTDGDTVSGSGWSLRALHTPGHAPDHLCFALEKSRILFSGDHVMGWNTSVIAPPEGRMSDYLASLERLLAHNFEIYLSGHGETIHDPQRLVRSYLLHRRMREGMILQCVQDGMSGVSDITKRVYQGISPAVITAAKLSVLAHLEHLLERGLVSCDGPPTLDRQFQPAAG